MNKTFHHEKLSVYTKSISFIIIVNTLLDNISKQHAVHNQLERASTSIPLNIAEGNGKSSLRDRCRFLEIARGSALESAACLDVLEAKGLITPEQKDEAKMQLVEIVSMLIGLIKSIDKERLS
jgi:four helix bundle protein